MMKPYKAISAQKKEDKEEAESSDDDDDADEDTKRRLRMFRESRAAREAMRQAERKVENLAESDDDARRGATDETAARSLVEAPPKPVQPKYGGALLKIKIRTEGDVKPLDYEIREDEPFAELFERYACDRGVNAYDCKFVFDGEVVGAGLEAASSGHGVRGHDRLQGASQGKGRPRPGERASRRRSVQQRRRPSEARPRRRLRHHKTELAK